MSNHILLWIINNKIVFWLHFWGRYFQTILIPLTYFTLTRGIAIVKILATCIHYGTLWYYTKWVNPLTSTRTFSSPITIHLSSSYPEWETLSGRKVSIYLKHANYIEHNKVFARHFRGNLKTYYVHLVHILRLSLDLIWNKNHTIHLQGYVKYNRVHCQKVVISMCNRNR